MAKTRFAIRSTRASVADDDDDKQAEEGEQIDRPEGLGNDNP